jgi:hypothetical protein
MPKLKTKPIVNVEALLLFTVIQQPQAAISQHAIAIHQEQLDARSAPFN